MGEMVFEPTSEEKVKAIERRPSPDEAQGHIKAAQEFSLDVLIVMPKSGVACRTLFEFSQVAWQAAEPDGAAAGALARTSLCSSGTRKAPRQRS